jgi:hypothetical protein
MSNNLLKWFNDIKSENDLNKLIEDKTTEGLHLEFKTKHNPTTANLHKDDKKNFCKVLSGFANSDGGILIWGIKTNYRDESAIELKPISNIDDFIRKLKSYIISATEPIVDNILIEKIKKKGSTKDGYLKCFVPLSYKVPHRSSFDHEYYKRSIEGFYAIQHFDLEYMFGRRQRPELKIATEISSDKKSNDKNEKYTLNLSFLNEGRAIAKHFGLFCKFNSNAKIIQVTQPLKNVTSINDLPCVTFQNDVTVIHPNNITVHVGKIII